MFSRSLKASLQVWDRHRSCLFLKALLEKQSGTVRLRHCLSPTTRKNIPRRFCVWSQKVIACWDNVCVCFWWQLRGMTKCSLCIVSLATWSEAAWGEIGDYQFLCITKSNNISFPIRLLSSSLNLQPIYLHNFLCLVLREQYENITALKCFWTAIFHLYVESTNLKTPECTQKTFYRVCIPYDNTVFLLHCHFFNGYFQSAFDKKIHSVLTQRKDVALHSYLVPLRSTSIQLGKDSDNHRDKRLPCKCSWEANTWLSTYTTHLLFSGVL